MSHHDHSHRTRAAASWHDAAAPRGTRSTSTPSWRRSRPGDGLTAAEAEARLASTAPTNCEAAAASRRGRSGRAVSRTSSSSILLVAALLSAVMGHGTDAVAIAGDRPAHASCWGSFQEYRAERATAALQAHGRADRATVLRDGDECEVPARELVPGRRRAAARPATCPRRRRGSRVRRTCRSQEAALTGESEAVEKHAAALADADLPLGDRRNMAFMGTAVTYGRGRAVVDGHRHAHRVRPHRRC